jgi:hypothetical protein
MPVRILAVTLCLAAFCSGLARAAEFKPEVIKAAKRATAAVISERGSIASAYCIEKSGLFLTSGHALRAEKSLKLLLHAGEADERLVEVEIVRSDEGLDLALLKAMPAGDFPALKLAGDAEVVETQQLLVIGATRGELKTARPQSATIHLEAVIARVRAILKEEGAIQAIELAIESDRFRGGRPVLNEAGMVVGQTEHSAGPKMLAIPASRLRSFLGVPQVSFAPPTVRYERRYDPQTFLVRLSSFQPQPPAYSVTLKVGDGDARRLDFEPQADKTLVAKGPILEKPADPRRVPLEVLFAGGGLVRGFSDDVPLKAGKAGGKLSEIARIERRGDVWHFLGRNEQQDSGEKLGLKKLWVGKSAIDVPWSEARSIATFAPADELGGVPYELTVSAEGKTVATQRGEIAIVGRPPVFDTGDFLPLDGSGPWPAAFEAPPIASGSGGLKGLGRRYVRTLRGDWLTKDGVWELVFTIAKDDPIVFIGIGAGRSEQHEGEPQNSVNFRIHSEQVSKGEVVLTKSGPVGGQLVGKIPAGTHRAVIRKRGDRVTFAIDVGNNGASPDDIEQIVPDLRGFAPFLTEKNTYLFFGGGGTFQKMRLVP